MPAGRQQRQQMVCTGEQAESVLRMGAHTMSRCCEQLWDKYQLKKRRGKCLSPGTGEGKQKDPKGCWLKTKTSRSCAGKWGTEKPGTPLLHVGPGSREEGPQNKQEPLLLRGAPASSTTPRASIDTMKKGACPCDHGHRSLT